MLQHCIQYSHAPLRDIKQNIDILPTTLIQRLKTWTQLFHGAKAAGHPLNRRPWTSINLSFQLSRRPTKVGNNLTYLGRTICVVSLYVYLPLSTRSIHRMVSKIAP